MNICMYYWSVLPFGQRWYNLILFSLFDFPCYKNLIYSLWNVHVLLSNFTNKVLLSVNDCNNVYKNGIYSGYMVVYDCFISLKVDKWHSDKCKIHVVGLKEL